MGVPWQGWGGEQSLDLQAGCWLLRRLPGDLELKHTGPPHLSAGGRLTGTTCVATQPIGCRTDKHASTGQQVIDTCMLQCCNVISLRQVIEAQLLECMSGLHVSSSHNTLAVPHGSLCIYRKRSIDLLLAAMTTTGICHAITYWYCVGDFTPTKTCL